MEASYGFNFIRGMEKTSLLVGVCHSKTPLL